MTVDEKGRRVVLLSPSRHETMQRQRKRLDLARAEKQFRDEEGLSKEIRKDGTMGRNIESSA
jgi:hypothetical protein